MLLYPFQNKPFAFTCLQYNCFENYVGKGEIAHSNPFRELSTFFIKFRIVVLQCLQTLSIWTSQKFVIW